jgi:hypothetical protein
MYRTRDDAKADVFDYIERFYNPTPSPDDRIFEPCGVRAACWISFSGCQPNRLQLKQPNRFCDAPEAEIRSKAHLYFFFIPSAGEGAPPDS